MSLFKRCAECNKILITKQDRTAGSYKIETINPITKTRETKVLFYCFKHAKKMLELQVQMMEKQFGIKRQFVDIKKGIRRGFI